MRWIVLLGLFLMLCGCQVQPVWEHVEDLQPAGNTAPWQEMAYDIQVDLPEQAVMVGQHNQETLYLAGDTEIQTTTFLASDYEAAVEQLSGYKADRLNILRTSRFDMPEYQFAWYSQTEEGGRLYRADLVMDSMTCYAVVCSAPEMEESFGEQARQVFASFGLSAAEPV